VIPDFGNLPEAILLPGLPVGIWTVVETRSAMILQVSPRKIPAATPFGHHRHHLGIVTCSPKNPRDVFVICTVSDRISLSQISGWLWMGQESREITRNGPWQVAARILQVRDCGAFRALGKVLNR